MLEMENKEEILDFELSDEEKTISKDVIKFYLEDEFFIEVEKYLADEDYALAKDAVKGLYILAMEFKLYKLYETLLDIYEDLEAEFYNDVLKHYELMKNEYLRLKEEYKNV